MESHLIALMQCRFTTLNQLSKFGRNQENLVSSIVRKYWSIHSMAVTLKCLLIALFRIIYVLIISRPCHVTFTAIYTYHNLNSISIACTWSALQIASTSSSIFSPCVENCVQGGQQWSCHLASSLLMIATSAETYLGRLNGACCLSTGWRRMHLQFMCRLSSMLPSGDNVFCC